MSGWTKCGWSMSFFVMSLLGMLAGAGLQDQGIVGVSGFCAVASVLYAGVALWRN